MPITVFPDMILSGSNISTGLHGKNIRQNSRIVVDSGQASVNIVWTATLREYDFGTIPMPSANWRLIEGIHEITEGGAYGFLIEDPKDYKVATGEGKMSEISSTVYQLQKRYTALGSSRYKDRKITRPKSTGFVVTYNGSVVSSGYTLDADTGRVTFLTDPGDPALLGWSGQFYVPVHFMDDAIDWDLVRPGELEHRLIAGPNVALREIRE